jgi:hypothetical protein
MPLLIPRDVDPGANCGLDIVSSKPRTIHSLFLQKMSITSSNIEVIHRQGERGSFRDINVKVLTL